ncbi:hypothetical protein ScalyP_jg6896, partial [Parmales sp. scaly parma]
LRFNIDLLTARVRFNLSCKSEHKIPGGGAVTTKSGGEEGDHGGWQTNTSSGANDIYNELPSRTQGVGGGKSVINLSEGFLLTRSFPLSDAESRRKTSHSYWFKEERFFLETKTNFKFPDPDFNWVVGFGNIQRSQNPGQPFRRRAGEGKGKGKGPSINLKNLATGVGEGVRNVMDRVGDIEIGLEEVNILVEL